VKFGDGIDARLGSVLFILSEFNSSRLPSSRFLKYPQLPILFKYHGETFLSPFWCLSSAQRLKNHATK
jgi:hypothetical protein